MKPDRVLPELCRGFELSVEVRQYCWKDAALYALGVGVSSDPLEIQDLQYTYENADDFSVLPSFATVIPRITEFFDGLTLCPGMPYFNPMMLLHGEQKLILTAPLPSEATVKCRNVIEGVHDKNTGAVVVVRTTITDEATERELCSAYCSLFIRGLGGFGGSSETANPESSDASADVYKKFVPLPPQFVYNFSTTPNQALLYRLSGDTNPLHADPKLAAVGGFSKPILHGLCTFGAATHAVVKEACGNKPESLLSIEGRFAAPVTPGDTLQTQIWLADHDPHTLLFTVVNLSKGGQLCLKNGIAKRALHSSL